MKLPKIEMLAASLAATIGAIVFAAAAATAAADSGGQHVSLSLNAGESYVIHDLAPDSTPSIRVLNNPHALVVHSENPGQVALLGAEAGQWSVKVTRRDGTRITYDVLVKSIAVPGQPLEPGKSPPAIGNPMAAALPSPAAASSPAKAAESPQTTTVSSGWAPPSPAPAASSPANVAALAETTTIAPEPAAPARDGGAAPAQPAKEPQLEPPAGQSQAVNPLPMKEGGFVTDPAVAASPEGYVSDSVSGGTHYMPGEGIVLTTGMSEIIDFPRRLTRVSIADSKVADIQVINPNQLNIIGHVPGFTTLAVWDDQGRYFERQVRIDASGKQQVLLNCIVAELDRTGLENQGINYSAALSNYGVTLFGLPGLVATPFTQSTSSTVSSIMPPGGMLLPLLLSENVTYGLSARNSNVSTNTFFQFLEQHNLGQILAEPHLLANTGEAAKFISGGEIPIVISQALNTSIVFKQYGTSVEFVPTVVGRHDIELFVKPEVSQPNYAEGVNLFGFTVPAFVTRRAETLVQLKDGQTLIIAGLILRQKTAQIQKVPYLGDIPYVGGMFRNTSWTNTESDLVMSVTPQIVAPLPAGGEVFLPSERAPMTRQEIETHRLVPADASRPRF